MLLMKLEEFQNGSSNMTILKHSNNNNKMGPVESTDRPSQL